MTCDFQQMVDRTGRILFYDSDRNTQGLLVSAELLDQLVEVGPSFLESIDSETSPEPIVRQGFELRYSNRGIITLVLNVGYISLGRKLSVGDFRGLLLDIQNRPGLFRPSL